MGYGDKDTEERVVRPLFHLASEDAPGEAVTFTFSTDSFAPWKFPWTWSWHEISDRY